MKIGIIAMATLATCLVSACGGASEPAGGSGSAGGEPALVITDQAEWDALVASGEATYQASCETCHPGGEADLGPAIKGHALSMAAMTQQIREGSARMKPIDESKLPEAEMRGLMVYLATMSAVGDVKGP